jgi:hypothetical protein
MSVTVASPLRRVSITGEHSRRGRQSPRCGPAGTVDEAGARGQAHVAMALAPRATDLQTPCPGGHPDVLEANLVATAARAHDHGVALPTARHETQVFGDRRPQVARGEVGITVATVGEAEVFADAGFTDLFTAMGWASPRGSCTENRRVQRLRQHHPSCVRSCGRCVGSMCTLRAGRRQYRRPSPGCRENSETTTYRCRSAGRRAFVEGVATGVRNDAGHGGRSLDPSHCPNTFAAEPSHELGERGTRLCRKAGHGARSASMHRPGNASVRLEIPTRHAGSRHGDRASIVSNGQRSECRMVVALCRAPVLTLTSARTTMTRETASGNASQTVSLDRVTDSLVRRRAKSGGK